MWQSFGKLSKRRSFSACSARQLMWLHLLAQLKPGLKRSGTDVEIDLVPTRVVAQLACYNEYVTLSEVNRAVQWQ